MQAFTTLTSKFVPLVQNDIDTDQIIPARFLKTTTKKGLGQQLFFDWCQDASFVLNRYSSEGRAVLLTGVNFGCGSSREHAPWALMDWGFRVIVALSFADIFRNNALKNGLLPISLDAPVHGRLVAHLEAHPDAEISIDVARLTAALPTGETVSFPLDDFSKNCLLKGKDQLGYLMGLEEKITAYESSRP